MSATKQALFDKGLELHLAYKGAKTREREIARLQAEARVQDVLDQRNIFLAALVDDEGFSINDVTRILDNKNWDWAKKAVEAGRAARQAAAPAPIISIDAHQPDGPYSWIAAEQRLEVSMAQAEFEEYLPMLARHPHHEGEQWEFSYADGKLLPHFADDDATWEHPVVQVVMTERGKQQAIAYIEAQSKAAA
ncbi:MULTISPECIES: hypothetical protein [unclassified Microbacterium]|uniref:hypothetical protein n=1 Tax=unclassified Microbacterium TaxID=2609290 RepID=UPI000EA9EB4E|nr:MULTISPECIES: hypothetical protein [unclassified Microbacterium]MBT2484811.1 hypothetical protein [Microbacterium sp. ISL-108]RKN67684.1 hypothetical protein D7252_08855 [Microbacterium sp. CGR2]